MPKTVWSRFRRGGHVDASALWFRMVVVVAVTAMAVVVGQQLTTRWEIQRGARKAADFAAKADAQAQRVEGLYLQPIHDLRFARRQVARQLAAVVGELGLGRDAERYPEARRSVARLYSAIRRDDVAGHFLDQLWQAEDHSPEVACARSLAHGRRLVMMLIAPRTRVSGQQGEATALPDMDTLEEPAAKLEQSLRFCHGEPAATDAALEWLQGRRAGDPRSGDPRSGDPRSGDPRSGDPHASVAATDALERLSTVVLELSGLEAAGVDPQALAAAVHLIHSRLSAREPGPSASARTAAVEAFEHARARRPSDPDVLLGLCAARLDELELEMARERAHGAGTEPGTPGAAGPGPQFARAEVACQDGLRTSPDSIPLLLGRSRVDLLHARQRLLHGLDPSPWITDSRRLTRHVLALDPGNALALADEAEAAALEARLESNGAGANGAG